MSEKKYGQYIIRDILSKSKHPEITAPTVYFSYKDDTTGKGMSLEWSCITRPFAMEKKTAVDNFDRFLVFAGGDPQNMDVFKGEMEISLGEKGEKHTINECSVVFIPAGIPHYPLTVRKIDEPVMMLDITTIPPQVLPDNPSDIRYVTAPMIKPQNIVTQTYRNDKLILQQTRNFKELIYMGKEVGGGGLSLFWFPVNEPHVMFEPPHSHDHDMLGVMMGSDPLNVGDFHAEVDMWLGEEGEKHSINSIAVTHHPAGLIHRHVDFQRVDKPFMEIHIFMAAEYQKLQQLETNVTGTEFYYKDGKLK